METLAANGANCIGHGRSSLNPTVGVKTIRATVGTKNVKTVRFGQRTRADLTHPINETINLTRSARNAILSLLYPYTQCLPSLSRPPKFLFSARILLFLGTEMPTLQKNDDDGQTYRKAGAMDALYTLDAAVLRF